MSPFGVESKKIEKILIRKWENKTTRQVKKAPQLSRKSRTLLDPTLRLGLKILGLWNLMSLVIVGTVMFFNPGSSIYAGSFGDYHRSDLFYFLVQGNFGNPYSYHSEIPNLQTMPYLPFPFLLMDFFQIKLSKFGPNLFFVQVCILILIVPFAYIFWKILEKMRKVDKVTILVSLVIFTVPTMYIFSTGNIQGVILAIALVGFLAVENVNLERGRVFLSTFLIFASKPQYVLFIAYQAMFVRKRYYSFLVAIILAIAVSIFGFFHYPTSALSNFNYWKKSLVTFVNPDPALIVHNNVSIIGNFTALETFFFPKNYNNLLTLQYRNFIIFFILILVGFLLFRIWKIESMHWIKLWLIGGIPIFLTPLSYSYNLSLLLIPIGLFFAPSNQSQESIRIVNKSIYLKVLLLLTFFLLFAPKPVHVVLIPGVADTNLFTMVDSFSYFLVILIGWNLRKKILEQK